MLTLMKTSVVPPIPPGWASYCAWARAQHEHEDRLQLPDESDEALDEAADEEQS